MGTEAMTQEPKEYDEVGEYEEYEPSMNLVRQVPIGIVFARIVVVTAMSVCAALAIFLAVGALWLPALAGVAGTIVFLFLMFFVERFAEPPPEAHS